MYWLPPRVLANAALPLRLCGYTVCDCTFDVTYPGVERRRSPKSGEDLEPVVLKKKFAEALNGIVLAGFKVGDRLCLGRKQAAMLVAEGWACPVSPEQRRRPASLATDAPGSGN